MRTASPASKRSCRPQREHAAPRRAGTALTLVASLIVISLIAPATAFSQRGPGHGNRSADLKPCDDLMDRGQRSQARRCYFELLKTTSDPATHAEVYWAVGSFKSANEHFRMSVKARPEDPDARVRWGYLFLQTHNPSEAAKLFDEALKIDETHLAAKLAKATVLSDRFEGKALELTREVLDADPDLVEAYLLLARMTVEEGKLARAREHLDKALEKAEQAGQTPLEVYALQASIDMLSGDSESEWFQRALAYNPTYGRVYSDAAHFFIINRRYREATALYEEAIEIDPRLWSAHADLAINLMREGEIEAARRHLELAYQADPYSAKTVNTLRLLDSLDEFGSYSNLDDTILGGQEEIERSIERPRIVAKLHKKEAAALRPYVLELAERSLRTFAAKYRFKPQRPVQVELYPDHEDFAVRTVGLPGVGLLGVTFGYVIAMDSPSGRRPGSFHWGTTLWHEMAHVVTLEATNHLVPRWFSEGISVYEEWVADPAWGDRISPDVIKAIKDDEFLPIAELDGGFVRPKNPKQVPISYYQAGLVCTFIAQRWGFSKLPDLLTGFGEGKSTPDNIRGVLEISSTEFDDLFGEFVAQRTGGLVKRFPEWRKLTKQAVAAARKKNWPEVIAPATEAQAIYPEYVESGNSYALLAEAYLAEDDKAAAAEQFQRYQQRGGRSPATIKKLAKLLDELGRRTEALEALEGLLYIAPGDEELHRQLGEWLLDADRLDEALREFKTLLALTPVDLAGAHFNLARAYHKMEDPERTREQVLMALEAAPSYRPAQKLLLEIVR